jgi:hypothetical protein
MTLKINGDTIKIADVEAKNVDAKSCAIKLIEEPKLTDRQKFLSLIEENLLLLVQNNITVKDIEYWIWYSYKIDINRHYLYKHLRDLKKKYNLNK